MKNEVSLDRESHASKIFFNSLKKGKSYDILNKNEMEELFKMNEEIRDVDAIAKKILEDEELMNAIDRMEMAIVDEKLKLEFAYENGEKSGIEKGQKENSKEIAKNLLNKGIDINTIIEVTKLSKEEIENL